MVSHVDGYGTITLLSASKFDLDTDEVTVERNTVITAVPIRDTVSEVAKGDRYES